VLILGQDANPAACAAPEALMQDIRARRVSQRLDIERHYPVSTFHRPALKLRLQDQPQVDTIASGRNNLTEP
jgi:hypothetical protein